MMQLIYFLKLLFKKPVKRQKGFRQMLAERQVKVMSLACIGLDPNQEKLPVPFKRGKWKILPTIFSVFYWMKDIVDATAPYASMYKPQSAYWEAIIGGRIALWILVRYINDQYPDIPIFLDCKRGDIDRTQKKYMEAHFGLDGVDGMNFSPYMGSGCMKNLIDPKYGGRAIVGLCYTSNPDARPFQDLVLTDGQRVWEWVARNILKNAEKFGIIENAGLVMAAAYELVKGRGGIYSEHLRYCREIVGNKLWFLIPGVGTQGGFVEQTVLAAYVGPGSIAINSSSGISEASAADDYKEAAGRKARELADQTWLAVEKFERRKIC